MNKVTFDEELVKRMIDEAVKQEREACAKVCDDHCGWTPRMIGGTIRARGQA